MVVYHHREEVAWDHHLLTMPAVETRVTQQCEE